MYELALQVAPALIGLLATVVGAMMTRSPAPQIVIIDGKVAGPEQLQALGLAAASPVLRQTQPRFSVGAALLDGGIIFALTGIAGFVIGYTVWPASPELLGGLVILSNLGVMLVGFTTIGALRPQRRWIHLGMVAVVIWLFSFINVVLRMSSVPDWLLGLPALAVLIAIGGGLSYLFRRG